MHEYSELSWHYMCFLRPVCLVKSGAENVDPDFLTETGLEHKEIEISHESHPSINSQVTQG